MTIYHKHHIIPKHMGGSDDSSNIAIVTVEQHAELHKQLWEDLGDIRDYYAWLGLSKREEEKIRLRCSLGGKIGGKKLIGIPKTKQHRERLSLSLTGRKQTEDHVQNVKSALSGSNNRLSKYYKVVDPDGNTYIIKGLNDFCRKHGLSQGNMAEVANGNRSHHKNWKCSYYDIIQDHSL